MTTTASRLYTLAVGLPLALLLAAPGTALPSTLDEPFVDLAIPDALARAEKEQKFAFVFFYDTEIESRRMLAQTYADEGVRSWMKEHVVAVKIGHTQLQQLGRFSVSKFPTTLLLRPDTAILYRVHGLKDAPSFLMALNTAILGTGNVERPEGANAENPMAWLAWANWLFANAPDRPEEVLAAYVWCLDRGDTYIPGFREAQFDYLLERIAHLKGLLQPATQALWDRRNRLRGEVVAGIGDDRDTWELWRFNYWLRDELNTLEVFDELKGRGEAQERARKILLDLDLHRFVAWERYEQVMEYVPEPYALIDNRLKVYEASLDPDAPPAPEARAEIVDDAFEYFETLLATGLGADGMKLFNRVTDAVPTGRAYHGFMERTNRLKLYPLTLRIAEKGNTILNDKGKRKMDFQLQRIPDDEDDQATDDGEER